MDHEMDADSRRPGPPSLALDFPAFQGRPVTEAHVRLCRERGHAVTLVDGVNKGVCPRCGEVTIGAQPTNSGS